MYDEDTRMLVLTKIFPPFHTGGVPNYYYNLLENCHSVKPYILTAKPHEQMGADDSFYGKDMQCVVYRKPFFPEDMRGELSWKWFAKLLRMVFFMANIIKAEQIDVVIVGQVQMFLLLAAFGAAKITGKPYFLFLHGEEIPQIHLRSNRYLKWLYFHADGYLCNSQFTARRLKKFIGNSKIKPTVITPGVEKRFFQKPPNLARLKERYELKNRQVIYTIARLDKRKGFDMVISALSIVVRKYPDVLYLIGGKGPEDGRLKKLVQETGLGYNVKFLGFVPDDELISWHYLGNIFVMPNRILADGDSEGFGIVFLEANAAGNPVIGGNEGGSVDAVADGLSGVLVDPRNPEEIAETICLLFKDKNKREKLGSAGKERARKEFSWPELAAQFEKTLVVMLQKTRCEV